MQTLDDHITGLYRNIFALEGKWDDMHEVIGPGHCCAACYWGRELEDVEEALERKEHYLKVLLCRKHGLKPKKVRTMKIKVECCPAPHKTTMFSVGRCRCGERDCPGRGVCHTCKGTGYKWGTKLIVVREWPPEIDKLYRADREWRRWRAA